MKKISLLLLHIGILLCTAELSPASTHTTTSHKAFTQFQASAAVTMTKDSVKLSKIAFQTQLNENLMTTFPEISFFNLKALFKIENAKKTLTFSPATKNQPLMKMKFADSTPMYDVSAIVWDASKGFTITIKGLGIWNSVTGGLSLPAGTQIPPFFKSLQYIDTKLKENLKNLLGNNFQGELSIITNKNQQAFPSIQCKGDLSLKATPLDMNGVSYFVLPLQFTGKVSTVTKDGKDSYQISIASPGLTFTLPVDSKEISVGDQLQKLF